ncbi:hypothetical protein JCGZ_16668 [Jatropha curcas]|uniref:Uncharacterized protein n=1 Tax=Jatropha curcas TaxID=180498 RepID=A0A067KEZ4_JATCU|nr:hypothetical protein JCGZ_16668 [Jatropha curcas]
MLHDQSGDEHTGDIDSEVGEVRGRKENIRIVDVSSDIDDGELLDVCFTYNLSPKYKLIHPSEGIRVTEPLDGDSIMMYEESFRSGVQFPLSEPLKSFFNEYNITVSQLYPNGLRLLCGLIALAHQDGYNVKVRARAVEELYHFSVHPMKDHCFLQAKNNYNAIAKDYPTYSPSGLMRPNPSFSEMAPKKSKSFKMAKVAETMKKKANAGSLRKDVPSVVFDAQSIEVDTVAEVTRSELPPSSPMVESLRKRRTGPVEKWLATLKTCYTEMEVKKNEMEDALKDAEVTMREHEAQHKAKINARDVDIDRLREENWDLLNKNKELESKVKEMKKELQKFYDQKGSEEDDLPKACLSLRMNIITKLKVK